MGLVVIALALVAALIGATPALAVSSTTPISEIRDNPCTGEPILITGQQQVDINENVSTSGTIQYHLNYRVDDVTAVGLTSGKRYVVQETDNHESVLSATTLEETFDTTFHYIRLGDDGTLIIGDDFYLSFKAHFTLNASGSVAVTHDFGDEPCQ